MWSREYGTGIMHTYLQQDQKVQKVRSRESRTGSVEQGIKDRKCGAGSQGQEVWSRESRTGSVERESPKL